MNTHNIDNLFTILIEALINMENPGGYEYIETVGLVTKAQDEFKALVLKSLPQLTAEEKRSATSASQAERLEAITGYRGRVKCNLYEAKDKVDSYRRKVNAWSHA